MSRDSNSLATDRQDRGAGANIPKPSKKDRNQLKTRGDFYNPAGLSIEANGRKLYSA